MSVVSLTTTLVARATCTNGRSKENVFDVRCKGLMLEVRASGGKTWYLRWTDHRGRQRQLRIADARDLDLGQARDKADELRSRIALGEDPAEERKVAREVQTFKELIDDRYLPYIKGYKRSWQNDTGYFRLHIMPTFGRLHLDEITQRHVADFHHAMRARGYAPATCNRCLLLLRHIFNRCLEWGVTGVAGNPTKGVPLFEENNKRERYLADAELRRLHEAVVQSKNTQLRYIVAILIMTGARKREVLDAKWADFDVARRQWRIPMSKSGRARHVPISDSLVSLLATIPRNPNNDYLVADPKTNKPFISIHYFWHMARKQAGLADVRMHDLRHSFASILVNSGRTLYEVQKILGHTQIRTTQRYAHLSQETLIDAANSAGAVISAALLPLSRP